MRVCSVRQGDVLVFNSEYVDVVSAVSHSKANYFDDLSVTPLTALRPPSSVIMLTVNLSGSRHAGPT